MTLSQSAIVWSTAAVLHGMISPGPEVILVLMAWLFWVTA